MATILEQLESEEIAAYKEELRKYLDEIPDKMCIRDSVKPPHFLLTSILPRDRISEAIYRSCVYGIHKTQHLVWRCANSCAMAGNMAQLFTQRHTGTVMNNSRPEVRIPAG